MEQNCMTGLIPGEQVIEDNLAANSLARLAAIAEDLGAEHIASEARELSERLGEGRFYVACVGQFKRGKSTLINALLQYRILPAGFTPVTAVPTVIRYSGNRSARIRTKDGAWHEVSVSDLEQYVTEEHNPENAKGISAVEVFVPSPLLATGLCFVDTPGLGSVFSGNTAATHAFVPQIDAALIVIGADPPLAGEELALIEAVAGHIDHLVLVLNKADRATEDEKVAAVAFAQRQLEKRLHKAAEAIFEVSALERLEQRGPERDWQKLVDRLERLVGDSGTQLVRSAGARGFERFSEQLLVMICEERAALLRPIEESERRIAAMKQTVAEAGRSVRELGYLFMAEQQSISDLFLKRRKAFLSAVTPLAVEHFGLVVDAVPRTAGPAYRRHLMQQAQEIAQRHVLPWLRLEQEEGENQYRLVARRFQQMGNEFLTRLADAGIPELAAMPHALEAETGFRTRSRFSFLELIEQAQPASPLRWFADLFLGLVGAHAVIAREAVQFLNQLLETNSSRVQGDILNRVLESRGRLEAEIRKLLHQVSHMAERALVNARKVCDEGTPAVESALLRLDSLEARIKEAAGKKFDAS
ncbi:MAG: dynamin family protein [Terriglobales bacterium]